MDDAGGRLHDTIMSDEEASRRSIKWILDRLGSLRDLPDEVAAVVWVTVYRCMGVGIDVENQGGPRGLLKSMLVGHGELMIKAQQAILKLDFLQNMIVTIRDGASNSARLADGQLLIDILKWGMTDAAKMSGLRRMWVRRSAQADPLYGSPIPPEILT
jgi:hypothetical protein